MNKIYVNSDNLAAISCPGCGKSREIDVSKYLRGDTPVKLTYRFSCESCDCGHQSCKDCPLEECYLGHVNTVQLERRRQTRKDTRLTGSFRFGQERPREVVILDISRHGARMQFTAGKTAESGREGVIDFSLDDLQKTMVRKAGKILRAQGLQAVFLFNETSDSSGVDKAIDYYLTA